MGGGMEFVWLIGIVVLGGALFYAASRRRRLSRAQQAESDAVARRNWGKEEVH